MTSDHTDSSLPAVILAAHGERGGAGDDARLRQLAARVQRAIPRADVGCVRVNDEAETQAVLGDLYGRRAVVLPLLFSEGFFLSQRLTPNLDADNHQLAEVLAFWPQFADLLIDHLNSILGVEALECSVLLVAHGSSRSDASAQAAERVAVSLRKRVSRVETSFLEQSPYAADVTGSISSPYAMVGLFFGAGMHGAEDFESLVREAQRRPQASFTVGEIPGLTELVVHKAVAELEKLPVS